MIYDVCSRLMYDDMVLCGQAVRPGSGASCIDSIFGSLGCFSSWAPTFEGYLLPAFLPDKLPEAARWLVEPNGPLASKA